MRMNLRTVRKLFSRSPKTHRPVSVFHWNDHLVPERVVAQTEALFDAGMGGVLVRAGAGLPGETHLGEEWFEALGALARRARRGRGSVWVYADLEGLPERRIIEKILEAEPALEASRLTLKDFVASGADAGRVLPGDALAAFVVTREDPLRGLALGADGRAYLAKDATEAELVIYDIDLGDWEGRRFLVFQRERIEGRLNYFDRNAVLSFLGETHERCYVGTKRYFGNTIGLCLTGKVGLAPGPGELPWDPELPTLFRETRGYPIIPRLPALFFDVPGCEAVRYDFWTLVAEMFREGFAHPLGAWCEQHRIHGSVHYKGPGSIAIWKNAKPAREGELGSLTQV